MLHTVAALLGVLAAAPEPTCVPWLNMPGGDLPRMPTTSANAAACAQKCDAAPECLLYTFIAKGSPNHARCEPSGDEGCCWLKSAEVNGVAPVVWDKFACSQWLKVPPQSVAPSGAPSISAAVGKKNVLYIAVDDLRPELEAYGQNFTHNPNIKKLADSGLVFDNAYCQIAVCSPSRMSFLTGRRPDNAGIYNFVNHFRQSDCGVSFANVAFSAEANVVPPVHVDGFGDSGQCCSLCTQLANCTHWTYLKPACSLKGGSVGARVASTGAVSALSGSQTHSEWTSHPEAFKKAGFLTVQTGKIFHTEGELIKFFHHFFVCESFVSPLACLLPLPWSMDHLHGHVIFLPHRRGWRRKRRLDVERPGDAPEQRSALVE